MNLAMRYYRLAVKNFFTENKDFDLYNYVFLMIWFVMDVVADPGYLSPKGSPKTQKKLRAVSAVCIHVLTSLR